MSMMELGKLIDWPLIPGEIVLFTDAALAVEQLTAAIPAIDADLAEMEKHIEQHTKTLKYLRRKKAAAGHYLHMFQQIQKR